MVVCLMFDVVAGRSNFAVIGAELRDALSLSSSLFSLLLSLFSFSPLSVLFVSVCCIPIFRGHRRGRNSFIVSTTY